MQGRSASTTDSASREAVIKRNHRRYRKTRRLVLVNEPLCRSCKNKGRTVAAEEVHHIKAVATHPELICDYDNLMPLCKSCHSKADKDPNYWRKLEY